MISRYLPRPVRAAVRKLVGGIRRIAEDPSPHGPLDHWASPYTRNSLFVEVLEHPGCDHKYAWGVVQAASLAKVLGIDHVSVIEFGVAEGHSLLCLERIGERVRSLTGVKVSVFGFDTGTGLPKPMDYRDMPNLWSEGSFPMDAAKLTKQLTHATLVLGPVGETVPKFINQDGPPIAFAAFDVDLYSSTRDALRIFEADHRRLLPRVHCVFDDILGYTFGDHVGERLAIADFNATHASAKISPIYGLDRYVPERYAGRMWEKNYMAHMFGHPLYGQHDGSIPEGRPRP